jgi:YVTN family beta-propeller protein
MSRRLSIILAAIPILVATVGVLLAATVELNHPTGTKGILMVDKYGARIRFFDPATFKELSSFEVSKNPHDFALSADHRIAYVPIYGDGVYGKNPNPGHEIVIVDMDGRKLAGVIDIAPYRAPHGIQIDRGGNLYVACDLDRKLLIVDPQSRSIKAAIDTEGTGHWIGLLPDGSKIYVTNKTDRPFISVIDLKTRKIAGRIPAPLGTEGITVSPDGKRVVAMESTEATMIVIDPENDTVLDRIPLKGQTRGYKVYYSPDGRRLLTMSIAEDVVSIFDAGNLRHEPKTLPVGKDPMGFAFSADGNTVLVANHGDGTVSVIDLQKPQVVRHFSAGTAIETLSYY